MFWGVFRLVMALLLLSWAAGFGWYIAQVPVQKPETERQTDAIVALTGGLLRIGEALDILLDGKAEWLFISGVGEGITIDDIPELQSERLDAEMRSRIMLGYQAQDTFGNAEEVAAWLSQHPEIQAVRLVTAHYHMPRALSFFEKRLPTVDIVPHPVFPPQVPVDEWWKSPVALRYLVTEYHKNIGSIYQAYQGKAATSPADKTAP